MAIHDALFNPGIPPAKNLRAGYRPKNSKLGRGRPFLFLALGWILFLVDLFFVRINKTLLLWKLFLFALQSGGTDKTFLLWNVGFIRRL